MEDENLNEVEGITFRITCGQSFAEHGTRELTAQI
jgi:hypothetical protein